MTICKNLFLLRKNFYSTILHPQVSNNANQSMPQTTALDSITNPILYPNIHAWLFPFSKDKQTTKTALGLIELEKKIFGLDEIRTDILYRCIKYEESWKEAGTASTKTLGQVRGSSKKAFPQKGRGKARVGSIRAPQIRGGYTVHGPRPADKTMDIPRKVYDLGIRNALSLKFKQDGIVLVDSLVLKEFQDLHLQDQVESLSQKELLRMYLDALNLDGKKTYFMYGATEPDYNLVSASDTFTLKKPSPKLIHGEKPVLITPAKHVSISALLEYEYVVLDIAAVQALEQRYHVD